jgi:formamidopyrimidine-DNA glycosylase
MKLRSLVPELPEVESTRLTLEPALLGRRVERVELRRADVCEDASGRACSARDLLEGGTITELARHGKQMAIVARDGRVAVVHLGMSGSLRALKPGAKEPAKHVHIAWRLDNGATLVFRDPRRFGGVRTFRDLDAVRRTLWADLGPDAMRITAKALREAAGRSKRPIKAALLDQGVLAGVGNIYADEALFRAGIRPSRKAANVRSEEFDRLARGVRRTLMLATRRGGSTIRDYVDGAGGKGRAQLTHAVYGRAGERCLVCGGKLKGTRLAGRATVFCPACQK